MLKRSWLASGAMLIVGSVEAQGIELSAVLTEVRQNSLSTQVNKIAVRGLNQRQIKPRGAYDWRLSAGGSYTEDQSEQQSQLAGDSRKIESADISLSKMYSSGTLLSVKADYGVKDIEMASAATPISGAATTGASSINPEYSTGLSVTVSQPLLKGWNAASIKMQEKILALSSLQLEANNSIRQQMEQYQAENLYIRIVALDEKQGLLKKIVKTSKRFLKLMKRSTRQGRTTSVDVATSESDTIRNEGALLNVDLLKEELSLQLSQLVYPDGTKKIASLATRSLQRPLMKLGAGVEKESLALALKQRFDLQLLRDSEKSPKLSVELAEESSRSQLDLLLTAKASGLDENAGKAWESAGQDEETTLTVGLRFSKTLGGTASRVDRSVALFKVEELRLEQKKLLADIQNKIRLNYLKQSTAKKQLSQVRVQINSLERKRKEEKKRYLQARSGEIAVLKYEMEILSAELERISVYESLRLIEAEIRYLTHSYPGS